MFWRILADLVVALHFAFIAFVLAGGFLARAWPRVAWLHALALAWGLWILAVGAICPPGLTRGFQAALGTGLVLINIVAYGAIWRRRRARPPVP